MKKWIKRIGTGISIIIALAVAGLLFVHFMPGWGLYFVRSGSMVPTLNPGDLVITRPVGEIRPNTIVTFEQNDAMVTHRVIELVEDGFRTKGDANEDADPDLLTAGRVQGTYLFKIPRLGYINSFVSDRRGWFIVIIIPTIILVLFIVKDILKETFKSGKKEIKGGDVIQGSTNEAANTVDNGNGTHSNKQ